MSSLKLIEVIYVRAWPLKTLEESAGYNPAGSVNLFPFSALNKSFLNGIYIEITIYI